MHVLHIAQGFDLANLPAENGIFGLSRTISRLYRLVNSGDAVTPQLEWQELAWIPNDSLQDFKPDPRYGRPGNASLWVLGSEGLYHLTDLSSDWSNIQVTTYPGIPNYQAQELAISPDMNLFPVIYAMTWGGGVFKLDLSASAPSWSPVGTGFPMSWGNTIELSPDFLNDRVVFAGTQHGIFHCQDLPGASWTKAQVDMTIDSRNPSFRYYSPNNPANPDPTRPWNWQVQDRNHINPTQLKESPVYGAGVVYTTTDGDYAEFYFRGSAATIMAFEGPTFGQVQIEVEDELTGAQVITPFVEDLAAAKIRTHEIPITLPGQGVYLVRMTAILQPGQVATLDAVRITE